MAMPSAAVARAASRDYTEKCYTVFTLTTDSPTDACTYPAYPPIHTGKRTRLVNHSFKYEVRILSKSRYEPRLRASCAFQCIKV